MTATQTLGARALALFYAKHDAPEIARILTAEHAAHGRPITPADARELFQTEFRNRREGRMRSLIHGRIE